MKKKRNFLLKSILLQLNFSLEKAGILLVLVLVFSIQAKAYSQTRITAKRQGVTIDEVLKEVREKSGYRFLYRVEEVNRYGKSTKYFRNSPNFQGNRTKISIKICFVA